MDISYDLHTKIPLKFRADGKFRILMVSDIHGGAGYAADKTIRALQALVDETRPDLVLFGGDTAGPGVIHIETAEQLREMLDGLSSPMENAGIPWAHVYGNHDDNFGLSNAEQQTVYETYPHCVSKAGPADISGVGNYVLPVYSADGERILFNVFGLDSHSGMREFTEEFGLPADTKFFQPSSLAQSGYDTVHFDQIAWYWQTSRALELYNGAKIPALMFLHIPLPEHALITMHRDDCKFEGGQLEDVACTPLNGGLFSACLQRGDVRGVFCGHDHVNDFCGEYCGIRLGYDGFLSYHACHKNLI
ncbi:MAG: metallophosphoesterase family protein, partial [Clostridia bacterium]|nr:metallophosphoesterase family protein [Clostridia bacterium]